MKIHTSNFKEQIKTIGKEIDSRITFGETVLGKDDLNAVTPSYQGAILKSVMKQLDIDSNVEIPIGTILKYEFGLKVNGEYEYINYGNYVVYNIEKQEDTNSYKITCYDKLLYSMLDYVKLPITYPISIRDYINSLSTALGLKFANKNDTFANYDKQIQADLYDGLGYTFRDILDELAQVTASTICLNNNDELEIRYITETGDTIDEEFLKDVNVNFGEKFGAVNTIVLSRSGDSDSVYYPPVLPANPYEIKISDNQIMNGNDRADFFPDIYNKLNGLEFYTNDFVSTGIVYYDLCDRYSVKVGDTTYSCVMFNDEVLVTQGLEENVYTELPEQTETDYKHASKDDRMINQVYIIAKKNEAEILAVVNTTKQIQKEINPTKDESGSEIIIEDASNNPLIQLEIEGKSIQKTRSGKNLLPNVATSGTTNGLTFTVNEDGTIRITGNATARTLFNINVTKPIILEANKQYTLSKIGNDKNIEAYIRKSAVAELITTLSSTQTSKTFTNTYTEDVFCYIAIPINVDLDVTVGFQLEEGSTATEYEQYGVSPSPEFPSEIESVGYENLLNPTAVSTSVMGVTITKNEDNTYTFNGTSTSDYWLSLGNITLEAGTYTFNGCPKNGGTLSYLMRLYLNGTSYYDKGDGVTFTFTETTTIDYVHIYFYKDQTFDNLIFKPMITKGKKNRTYIPYGKYGIEVEIVGKNLVKTVTTGDNFVTDYIPVKKGQDYIYSENSIGTDAYFYFYQYIGATGTYTYVGVDQSWTAPSDGYVRILKSTSTRIDVMLQKGKSVSNYEPHQSKTLLTVLNAPLRSLPNGIKDIAYIRNNKLYVDRYVGSVVLNGSESWALALSNDNTNMYYVQYDFTSSIVVSSHFVQNDNLYTDDVEGIRFANNNRLWIRSKLKTVDEFKNWLSTHNTQVDYELAEPYTEELGEIEMLKTLKGYNNISTTDKLNPIINLTYVTDTQIANYVEEHMAQIKVNEDNIRLEVSKKIGSDEVVSSINQSAEQITLKSNRVVIESDNFTLDKDGTIKAKAGEIAGFNATEEGFYYLLQPKKNYTQEDIDKLASHIYNGVILTEEEKYLYDVNNDNTLNLQDIAIMGWTINNNISNSMPGKFQISIPKEGKNPFVIDFGLYDGFGNLLNGFTYNKATFVNTEINGDLTVTGTKNRMVTVDNKNILLNAYETTTPYFGDIGSSKTNENGYCKIEIEEIFSKTIESDDYKVFIQKCGQGDLYVIKHKKYFEVKGAPNLDFDWEIKAIQKGYKNIRLKEKER